MTEEQAIPVTVTTEATPPPDQLRPPYQFTQELLPAPEGVDVSEFERTPEGYLELEWQYKDALSALALDFDQLAQGMSRSQLEEAAADRLEEINAGRQEKGAKPLETDRIHENVLKRLAALSTAETAGEEKDGMSDQRLRHAIRPVWQDYMPTDDSEAALEIWESFKAQYPESIQINLEELRELDGKMRVLSADFTLMDAVKEIHADRLEVMRIASAFVGAERKIDALGRRIAETYRAAAASNRGLTRAEERHIARLQERQTAITTARGERITTPELLASVKEELHTRMNIDRRRDFERGLVMTQPMRKIIDELLPSLAQGRPALLVGETGGAKTALAEYISRHFFGAEPEFISGYGDVNSYQVMGKMSLTSKDGASESTFVPGPVVRAMDEGRPLILDEINAMPPEFLKRLNKIVQLKPGDSFMVQEDSGYTVTVKPGFVILATANEKSKRYKGVEDLSVEFQNRFGANVVRIHYPDNEVIYGQPPVENAIIARAALTDRSGALVGGISADELERFVRACHVTQQVFTGNHGNGFRDYTSSERIADGKPGLDETVLAPRTMVALLEKVRYSNGKVTLDEALERFVSGIKGDNDRKQVIEILKGQSFLQSRG